MANTPSTEWREIVDPDEEQRFGDYVAFLRTMQAKRSERYGPGRTLHRKPQMALPATLTVLDDLPEPCRHGLFAAPATYDARVRLSNGGPDVKPDTVPDIRGFAIKVLGVEGEGALGNGPTDCQDFLLINQPAFVFGTGDNFARFMIARSRGGLSLLRFLVEWRGWWGAFGALRKLQAMVARPFTGFATQAFHSAAPIQCGPYAVRVRLEPARDAAEISGEPNFGGDLERHLAAGALFVALPGDHGNL
ncbi:MAG: catalase, partial [Myxococcota bacterium]